MDEIDALKDFLVGCKPVEPVETPEEYQQLSLIDACLDRLRDLEEEMQSEF